ncbi:MAG: hypothetical protein U0T31_09680 [Chitinophagales bacterium]|nr:hypothetical protein [Chitinophagales bacterium]
MKKLILLFGAVALFTACKNNSTEKTTANAATSSTTSAAAAAPADKLKSAIYETEMEMPHGMGVTSTKVQFDDYGKKSRTEMKSSISFGGNAKTSSVNSVLVDGYVYTWQSGAKTGSKIKIDESKFDPKNADFAQLSEEMKAKLNYKEEGTETLNGKECRVGSFNAEQMKGKIWMWKQIPIQMQMEMMGNTLTSKLKNLEENPSFPAGTFDIPTDITFSELSIPQTATTH